MEDDEAEDVVEAVITPLELIRHHATNRGFRPGGSLIGQSIYHCAMIDQYLDT